MKGSVIVYRGKRGDVFRIKYADAAGKQVMETVGSERDGWTKRKAEAELRDRLVKVDKGGWRRPAPRTFASVLPEWRREEGARKDWKPSTAAQYASIEKRLSAFFGPMRLAAIRPADVSRYLAEMLDDYAPAHVCRDLAILHSIFKWAKKKGYTDSNPAEDADRPKVRQRKGHDLSPAQVQLLLRSFDDEQARTVFLTFVLTGIRNAELRAMRWRDVDLIENRLAIPDSKTEDGVRVVSLSPLLAEELWQHRRRSAFRGDDERVFCHPELGSEYHIATKYRPALERAFESAGLPWPEKFRPCHDLRVTAITTDARNGTDPIAIMANAGHSSYATTKRYVKLAGVVFPDAAAARERRLLGQPSTELSTDLREPERTEADLGAPNEAESPLSDAV